MDHGDNHITVIDEDGNEELCEILFTFDSEEFGKSYVVYYPISAETSDEDDIEIHAAAFTPSDNSNDGELMPVETDEEWDLIEEMLNTFLNEQDETDEEE